MLSRLIGISKAKRMIYLAERINSETAMEWGLADYKVDSYEDLFTKSEEICLNLKSKGSLALKAAKKAINQGIEQDIPTALEIEKQCYKQVLKSEDRLIALNAFVNKEKPVFKGR